MDKWFTYKDVECHYIDQGQGACITLVHGYGEHAYMWKSLAEKLSKQYRVLIPNLPGYGKTPMTQANISIKEMADYLHAVLQKAGVTQTIMIGHSMGGYVGIEFAAKYANMLAGFGLFNSHVFADTEAKKESRRQGIRIIEEGGKDRLMRELFTHIFGTSFKQQKPEVVEMVVAEAQGLSDESLVNGYRAMMGRPDHSQTLKGLNCPVLFIGGKEDNSCPLNYMLSQAAMAKIGLMHLLNGVGHMGMHEKKAETEQMVMDFAAMVLGKKYDKTATAPAT